MTNLLNLESNNNHIIKTDEKPSLKIGLYLQTDEVKNKNDFTDAIESVKQSNIDILVLPEFSYVPFIDLLHKSDILIPEDLNEIYDACLALSKEINKAIIISSVDKYGTIFSIFANAQAEETETQCVVYIKHTMTNYSPFDEENYKNIIKFLFNTIIYKGYRIGMTICYDCNHSIFSRMYGLKDIDIIFNSTGGDVVYDKWYKYNKVRAIENSCYNFVTMGGVGNIKNPRGYVYGFNKNGKELKPFNLLKEQTRYNTPGKIYTYDIALDYGKAEEDTSLNQAKTPNKNHHIDISVGKIDKILKKSKVVADNIYVYNKQHLNIVFCLVTGNEIIKPEKVLPLLYSEKLKRIENKRYIIVNKHKHIDEKLYKDKLSVIFKVRTMENFCALIVESNNINNCYQSGKNRTAQVLKQDRGKYRIDLDRTTGPEVIWRNKAGGMRSSWRKNFELLINELENESKVTELT